MPPPLGIIQPPHPPRARTLRFDYKGESSSRRRGGSSSRDRRESGGVDSRTETIAFDDEFAPGQASLHGSNIVLSLRVPVGLS